MIACEFHIIEVGNVFFLLLPITGVKKNYRLLHITLKKDQNFENFVKNIVMPFICHLGAGAGAGAGAGK